MQLLSKNFTAEEFYKSPTATRYGIDNRPNAEVLSNLTVLVNDLLQPLRDKLEKPIKILSGYRCLELNKVVGGAVNSDHIKGYAADIEVQGMDNKELFLFVRDNFRFTKLILEFYEEGIPDSGWVHIGVNPKELTRYCYIAKKDSKGKTIYVPCV